MGLGAQLTIWPDSLFQGLAARGFYVIRFDNRDTGLSTGFDSWGVPNLPAAGRKVRKGGKGGMIVHIVAAQYPERTRSMVSIYSTSGRPGLPPGKPEALAILSAQPEGPSREQRVKHGMKLRTVIGSPGYPADEATLRAFVEKNVDRRWYPEGGARQYLSIIASGDRVELLKTIKAPTLVLHGEEDPLLPVEC